jgi:hypothetical protein
MEFCYDFMVLLLRRGMGIRGDIMGHELLRDGSIGAFLYLLNQNGLLDRWRDYCRLQ